MAAQSIREAMASQQSPEPTNDEAVVETPAESGEATGEDNSDESAAEPSEDNAETQSLSDDEPDPDSYEDPAEFRKALKEHAARKERERLEEQHKKESDGLYHDLRKQRAAKRELMQKIAALEAQQASKRVDEIPEPRVEDFTDPISFAKAVSAYDRAQEAHKSNESRRQEAEAQLAQEAKSIEWDYKINALGIDSKDYAATMHRIESQGIGQMIVPQAVDAILASPVGPAIYHFLGNNPRVAEEIEDMPAHQQVAAVRSLETRLFRGQLGMPSSAPAPQQRSAPTPPPPAPTRPATPPPPAPPAAVRGSAATGSGKITDAKDMTQFMARRKAMKRNGSW